MAGSEFNFFQLTNGITGGMGTDNQHRAFDKKISDFGAMDKGTKYMYGFKDEIANPMPRDVDGAIIENPFVEGSTIKRVRDEKFIRMSMGSISQIEKDTNDRDKAAADKDYYMPEEGWRSFGGRRDFDRTYQGSQLKG